MRRVFAIVVVGLWLGVLGVGAVRANVSCEGQVVCPDKDPFGDICLQRPILMLVRAGRIAVRQPVVMDVRHRREVIVMRWRGRAGQGLGPVLGQRCVC